MTDDSRPLPENVSIEQQEIQIQRPSYGEALNLVHQAIYGFRRAHAAPDDPTLPVVRSYEAPQEELVDIISTRAAYAVVQVESKPQSTRIIYTFDPAADFYLTISVFESDTADRSSNTYGVIPSQEGILLLLKAYHYIRAGTDDPS